ncbi:MAG: M28 family peptidase, partial [Holophagales bacterium]|nr:M28 family peptidase [Holophagales bacterium]
DFDAVNAFSFGFDGLARLADLRQERLADHRNIRLVMRSERALGFGGRGSFEPDSGEVHNGADDNASGTAALLEVARGLAARRSGSSRDVWLVGFSAEESGLLGSTALVRRPPPGLEPKELLAMINFDMVGRLEGGAVQVLGAASAEEWSGLLEPVCQRADLECRFGGDGYGPSDQTPFYAAGVPVLHWFTGTHEDYHRPSDDASAIDAEGIVRIASANVDLLSGLAARPAGLTYVEAAPPQEGGDVRSFGASLGTIPDYVGDERPGVLLAGARPDSAADKAGVQKGDLLVELGGQEIRNIYDFVFVLRSAKPGQTTTLVVLRGEERLELEVTYGQGRGRP